MAIKQKFTEILKDVDTRNNETREKLTRICNNGVYSYEGKRAAVEKIQASTAVYIEDMKKKVADAVEKKVAELDAIEKDRLNQKNSDASYQNLLASTLQILPAAASTADPIALKDRLSVFNDDPIAVAAISETLRKSTHADGESEGHEFNPAYMDMLPVDRRGERQKRLKQLGNTMLNHLDSMAFTVQDKAFQGGDFANVVTIHGGSNVNATLDYIAACEDDDCTIFRDDSLL